MVDLSSNPSRFAVLDPTNLGEMEVLEELDSEAVIAARMQRVKTVWTEYDPPAGAAYDVEALEFDPIRIVEECDTYFETLLRDRVNQAVRAITLAFATGTDLDAIASRYPGGMPRLDQDGDGEPDESDDRFRRRVWSSPNALSPHGTPEAYEFWGLSALATLRDVRTVKIRPSLRDNPLIVIACLNEDAGSWSTTATASLTLVATRSTEPRPTATDLLTVRRYIQDEARQGLTDEIAVVPPKIKETDYNIGVTLFPGTDPDTAMASIMTSLQTLLDTQCWLGYDHTLSAIHKAAKLAGVHNVIITAPTADIKVDNDWFVQVDKVTIRYLGRAE